MGKKIFFGIIIVFILLLAGTYIFINTFNLNTYLPQITNQASQSIGREVKIQRAKLHFSLLKGVSARVEGVLIGEDPAFGSRPFLTVGDIQCGVRFLPLLTKRQVEVSYIRIHQPEIVLVKGKTGIFNFESLMKATQQASGGSSSQKTSSSGNSSTSSVPNLPVILVSSFQMDKARVTYSDQSATPPMEFSAQDIDIQVTDFSLTEPFKIKAEASLFSDRPNMHINGLGRLDMKLQQVRLDDVHLNADLSSIDLKILNKTVAALESAGIQSLHGQLNVVASQMLAGAGGLLVLSLEGQLSDGLVKLKTLAVPADKIFMKFDASESRINVKEFSLILASGEVRGQGTVKNYMTLQQFDFNTDVKQIRVAELIDQKNYPAQLQGSLSGNIKVNGQGFTPEAMDQLTGGATFTMADGELVNLNIVKSVLASISVLPGLAGIEDKLPPDLRQKISGKNTKLDKVEAKTRFEHSQVLIDTAQIEMQGCLLSAHGRAGFDQTLDMTAELIFLKDMANALTSSSNEMEALVDENQEIHIPVKIAGKIPALSILPDINYLSRRLLVNQGGKQLEKVIEKNPEVKKFFDILTGGNQTESKDGSQNADQTVEQPSNVEESPEKKILNSLFKGF